MKRIFPIILVHFICYLASAQAPEVIKLKKDVVDYYWEMSCVDEHLVSYPLEIKSNKWTTVSVADYELEADVNVSRGFVFIKDPARDTLDTNCSFQFMLFQRSKGDPIVGISKKIFNGKYWEADMSFWKKNSGKWFKVNDEVITELTYRDFLEGGNDGFIYDDHISKIMPLHYELPKKGKIIKISLLDDYFKEYCLSIKPDDPGCGIRGSFKDVKLELKWNKSKEKFVLLGDD